MRLKFKKEKIEQKNAEKVRLKFKKEKIVRKNAEKVRLKFNGIIPIFHFVSFTF